MKSEICKDEGVSEVRKSKYVRRFRIFTFTLLSLIFFLDIMEFVSD